MNILYRFDEFELNPARRSFTRSGEAITLAPKTFDVLAFLAANPGRVLLKQEILDAVWPGAFVEEGNLTQHIFWIRKALGDRASAIVTIPGRGYHFIVPVEIVDLTPPEAATVSALPELPASPVSVLRPSRRPHMGAHWHRCGSTDRPDGLCRLAQAARSHPRRPP